MMSTGNSGQCQHAPQKSSYFVHLWRGLFINAGYVLLQQYLLPCDEGLEILLRNAARIRAEEMIRILVPPDQHIGYGNARNGFRKFFGPPFRLGGIVFEPGLRKRERLVFQVGDMFKQAHQSQAVGLDGPGTAVIGIQTEYVDIGIARPEFEIIVLRTDDIGRVDIQQVMHALRIAQVFERKTPQGDILFCGAVALTPPETVAGVFMERTEQHRNTRSVGTLQPDEESGQTIISGMGELHLEILVDRMKREFNVEASVGKPQVAYRETIRSVVENAECKFAKQSGGRGQYGHVVLKLEPLEPGKGFEFVDAIKGGVVPREYIPAVEKGVEDTLKAGVLAGYPVVDVKVTLHFGSYHEVDSNENAFKMAASMAFKEGMRKADPVLLEPIMAVEVETPEEKMGDVMGDLSSRRGVIQGMDDLVGGGKSIKAEVPLAEMFGYATQLRSLTQGRATYTMEFKHYAEAPRNVAEAVIADKAK